MAGDPELDGIERIDELVAQLETGPDAGLREVARELVRALMEFHRAGLERMMALVREGPAARAALDRMAGDDVVRNLLLLYDLHPVDIETRVRAALDQTRPYLESHGGNVELAGVLDDGTVQLWMRGSCQGCPSSAVTLKLAIEDAIRDAAPDATSIVVLEEGANNPAHLPLVELQPFHPNGNGSAPAAVAWEPVELSRIPDGSVEVLTVRGREVLFCRIDETFFAYGHRCAACGGELAGGRLADRALSCPACGLAYDLVRAGRALDRPDLHLDPFPLLVERGQARIAIAGATPSLAGSA